ncbi:MAG: hypothetical protein D8M59_09270 [Planctomycetes bacterium]|nr:hypothetical protein [Planctomycetota bacterium]NOG54251.1 hypothetical protein [Planctomycetota bacterium]
MNWITFLILAYLFAGFDLGLHDLLAVRFAGGTVIAPSFVLVLMVCYASMAPAYQTMWSALLLGLIVDLTARFSDPTGSSLIIVGPNALGFMLGAALILQMRSMMYRRHPFVMPILTLLAGIAAVILAVFLISVRHALGAWSGWYPSFTWSATTSLYDGFFIILYSAVISLPISWILQRINPILGFQMHSRIHSH